MSRADQLAELLNAGADQQDALEQLGIDEDECMGEEYLGIGDVHNCVIDLCDGTYVQRHGSTEYVERETRHVLRRGGTWLVHTYPTDAA